MLRKFLSTTTPDGMVAHNKGLVQGTASARERQRTAGLVRTADDRQNAAAALSARVGFGMMCA
jgi:hypothetical protein